MVGVRSWAIGGQMATNVPSWCCNGWPAKLGGGAG